MITIIAFMKNIIRTKLPVFTLTFFLIAFVFMLGASKAYAGVTLNQTEFGFRNDNGSESTATWMATQNTNVTNTVKNTAFRIRITTQWSGTPLGSIDQAQLEYLPARGGGIIV